MIEGLRFSFADGTSGGTMNLSALLGGATPDQLCARWRTLEPTAFVSLRPLSAYANFPNTGALGDFDSIEAKVFPHLGIDAAKVRRAQGVTATFNVCDFDDKVARAIPHEEISAELLLAAISLPLATPPVRWQGKTWTDAVWIRQSNLMAAVTAGANELWVAWLIGNTPRFKDGLIDQYVHMIEMAAAGALNEELAEIARLNARIAAGEKPYGHDAPIVVHLIRPEITLPLDPEFLLGRIDGATLVAYGYRDAIRYLAQMSPGGTALDPGATKARDPARGIQFRETMTGRIAFGETDPKRGYKSLAAMPAALHATIDVDDIKAFVLDPDHMGVIAGHLELHRRGGWLPATRGVIGLFTPARDDPKLSYMIYAIGVVIEGRRYWVNGRKHVRVGWPVAIVGRDDHALRHPARGRGRDRPDRRRRHPQPRHTRSARAWSAPSGRWAASGWGRSWARSSPFSASSPASSSATISLGGAHDRRSAARWLQVPDQAPQAGELVRHAQFAGDGQPGARRDDRRLDVRAPRDHGGARAGDRQSVRL